MKQGLYGVVYCSKVKTFRARSHYIRNVKGPRSEADNLAVTLNARNASSTLDGDSRDSSVASHGRINRNRPQSLCGGMENAAAHRIKKRAVKLPSFSLGMLE